MELHKFFHDEYAKENLLNCEPETLVQYRVAINHLNRFFAHWLIENNLDPRPIETQDLTNAIMREFAAWLLSGEKKKRSPATVNKTRTHLKALWRYAFKLDKAPECPSFKRIKEPKKNPWSFTQEDFQKLLKVVNCLHGYIEGLPRGDFWRALIFFLVETGARIDVTMNLVWSDIDLDACEVHLRAENQKPYKDQVLLFSEYTASLIRKAKSVYGRRSIYVFAWPNDRYINTKWTSLHREFRAIVMGAGIDPSKKTFHRLRVTAATIVATEYGVEAAKELLGHASAKTTINNYIDDRAKKNRRNCADRIHSALMTAAN